MRLVLAPPFSEKTEQHTAGVTLRNLSASPCSLDGYPTVALSDGRGRRLHFDYRHQGDQMITSARPRLVRLDTNASAFFAFNKNVCVSYSDRYARVLRVTLPGRQTGRSIGLPRYPIIDYCDRGDPGKTITVSPIVRRSQDALCLSQRSCRRR
jgi:hypothetical protein